MDLCRRHGYYSYMDSVNIADLKNRLSQYLSQVRAGEEIVICDRNLPIARIVPIHRGASEEDELLALAAEGKIRLAETTLDDSFWKLPAPRVSAKALKHAVDLERDDR
jgi:prevent-host-death family protein